MCQVGAAQMQAVRRVLLSPDALCLSLGHFLELSFDAPHLKIQGRSLHGSFVRYFGTGAYLQMLCSMHLQAGLQIYAVVYHYCISA